MTEAVNAAAAAPGHSSWSPLRNRVFFLLWTATVASNVGSWMNDVGTSWTMLSLSPDPLMVALVQAAGSLPMFLFALPSGVMADIVDRRKLLIVSQWWVFLIAGALGLLTMAGLASPWLLLASTFLLSAGAALSAPAFQAIVPDLVPASELAPAVALNSLGINISRAIGPALGGVILSFSGPEVVFLLNAVSVLGVLYALYRWHPAPLIQRLPPEHFFTAVRAGLRYVRSAPLLRTVLLRAAAFFLFGSAGWAMLPLVARKELALGPGGYGLLLASIGVGAIGGAMLLPKVRGKIGADRLTVGASWLFALTMLALAYVRQLWLLNAIMLLGGLAWIAMLSTLNMGAQRSAAKWVKARGLAAYLTVFFGSMTLGSAIWGKVAALSGAHNALLFAAIGMVLATATALRWRLDQSPALNLDTVTHTNAPRSDSVAYEKGPVMISVEYDIDPLQAKPFAQAIQDMRRVRRRGGALSWSVYEDVELAGRFIEVFVMESWLEHLRQHDRHTVNDKLIQAKVQGFHLGQQAPRVCHYVAPE